ncbi:hypothetical protein CCY01nite_00900 [Chitinophaga cymbidii]|uniref:Uncharacterized protein n=1 Tax=Chitinophaga cymbidii TaxID=1096750 RepID=A0A512RDQ5_9BACT|nr:hypothetical protein CCY01nite_00900 [Chitinophaga cymbidii]
MNVTLFGKIKLHVCIVIYILSMAGSACKMPSCPRDNIVAGAKYFNGDTVLNENSYFIFYDSIQLDYLNGRLVTQYDIKWHGCSEYSLIIKSIEEPDLLKAGDTLNISILSNVRDTFRYLVKFREREAVSYFFKKGGQ